eukprot:scaffold67355_cov43-Cyclotella_meneghiniana.AAC.2
MVSNLFGKWGVVVVVFFETLLALRTGTVPRLTVTVATVDSFVSCHISFSWSCCFQSRAISRPLPRPLPRHRRREGKAGSGRFRVKDA